MLLNYTTRTAHSLLSPQHDAEFECSNKAPESSYVRFVSRTTPTTDSRTRLVGMTGGQVFHTLMVQHGVKQICESLCLVIRFPESELLT
jgi:hypothetical protein